MPDRQIRTSGAVTPGMRKASGIAPLPNTTGLSLLVRLVRNPITIAAMPARRSEILKEPTRITRGLSSSTPDSRHTYNNRGNIRQIRGDLNGAIADYTEAIALDRNFGLAYINRATVRRLKGDLGAALEDLNQAVSRSKVSRSKCNPGQRVPPRRAQPGSGGRSSRARSSLSGEGRFRKGAGRFRSGYRDQSPLSGSVLQPRHRPARPRRLDGALSDYDRAIALDPNLAQAYNQRGVVRQVRGDLDGAIADYSRSIEH